jgi:ribosome-dependent ATPase
MIVATIAGCILIALAVLQFGLTVKGSMPALLLGGLLYVFATSGLGLLVSSFARTQVAALVATAVIVVVPALQFSGYLSPAAALDGTGYWMGHLFPSLWFQNISLGVFAKGRSLAALAQCGHALGVVVGHGVLWPTGA